VIVDAIAALARRVQASPRITVVTGAGISAASGVPTFRGAGGLWRNYSAEQLATPEAFRRDPKLVWEWYEWRRERIATCLPNAAHEVLAAWSLRLPGFSLVTQNVDGLHERAGTRNVIRFHGSIWEVLCWQGCPSSPGRWRDDRVPLSELPPPCPHCDGILRPGIVWFGEGIDPDILERATDAAKCDLFMSVGTSAVVYPAAGLLIEARSRGAFTVEINPEATPSSRSVDLAIAAPSEEILPAVEAWLLGQNDSRES
jgi:NAD-dependent deacetylase